MIRHITQSEERSCLELAWNGDKVNPSLFNSFINFKSFSNHCLVIILHILFDFICLSFLLSKRVLKPATSSIVGIGPVAGKTLNKY